MFAENQITQGEGARATDPGRAGLVESAGWPEYGVSPEARRQLQRWARSVSLPHRLVVRSRYLLRLLDGQPAVGVAREFGVSRETVRRWRDRLIEEGPGALLRDRPGRGRRPGRAPSVVAAVVQAAGQHPTWTLREIAAHAGTSLATVQRICREQGLREPGRASAQGRERGHPSRPA